MLGGTVGLSMLAWVVSARKWFKGPGEGEEASRRPLAPSSRPHASCLLLSTPPLHSTRRPLHCMLPPPTHTHSTAVRNVDVGNKTETLAEAAMRGELDETSSSDDAEGGKAGEGAKVDQFAAAPFA